jgi:four helix bundle protein
VIIKGSRIQGVKDSSEMLKNCKSYGSVCELETQILLAGDLDLIEKGELGPLNKDIAEIERMLKALIKSLENKPLNP